MSEPEAKEEQGAAVAASQPGAMEAPPVGEEIHLPGPSILPLLTAVGLTLLVIGLTTIIELTFIGIVITLVCVVRWVMDTRREMDELPSENDPHPHH